MKSPHKNGFVATSSLAEGYRKLGAVVPMPNGVSYAMAHIHVAANIARDRGSFGFWKVKR